GAQEFQCLIAEPDGFSEFAALEMRVSQTAPSFAARVKQTERFAAGKILTGHLERLIELTPIGEYDGKISFQQQCYAMLADRLSQGHALSQLTLRRLKVSRQVIRNPGH